MRSFLKLWTAVCTILEKIFKYFLWFLLGAYRTIGTTHLGGACRFTPSCSEYALESLKVHPSHKALCLISKRICKCRPGGPFGYDPVPFPKGNEYAKK